MVALVQSRVGLVRPGVLTHAQATLFPDPPALTRARRGLQPIWAGAWAWHVSPPCSGMHLAAKARGMAARMHQARLVSVDQITDAEVHQFFKLPK